MVQSNTSIARNVPSVVSRIAKAGTPWTLMMGQHGLGPTRHSGTPYTPAIGGRMGAASGANVGLDDDAVVDGAGTAAEFVASMLETYAAKA